MKVDLEPIDGTKKYKVLNKPGNTKYILNPFGIEIGEKVIVLNKEKK